jgi:hypothetical protein
MSDIPDLIREFRSAADRECEWMIRKATVRKSLLQALDKCGRHRYATEYGTAIRTTRVHLMPRRQSVLSLLNAEDLFPFTRFWPQQVQQLLVPKYGRDSLLPLFDIRPSTLLLVKGPDGRDIGGQPK